MKISNNVQVMKLDDFGDAIRILFLFVSPPLEGKVTMVNSVQEPEIQVLSDIVLPKAVAEFLFKNLTTLISPSTIVPATSLPNDRPFGGARGGLKKI